MTPSATRFLGPTTLAALTGHSVYLDVLEPSAEHVALPKWADAMVVAPATAQTLARMASGQADEPVSALFLSLGGAAPVVVAPAMHPSMWAHPAVRMNVERLLNWGVVVVGPIEGEVAAGDFGVGRMAEPEEIVRAIDVLRR